MEHGLFRFERVIGHGLPDGVDDVGAVRDRCFEPLHAGHELIDNLQNLRGDFERDRVFHGLVALSEQGEVFGSDLVSTTRRDQVEDVVGASDFAVSDSSIPASSRSRMMSDTSAPFGSSVMLIAPSSLPARPKRLCELRPRCRRCGR